MLDFQVGSRKFHFSFVGIKGDWPFLRKFMSLASGFTSKRKCHYCTTESCVQKTITNLLRMLGFTVVGCSWYQNSCWGLVEFWPAGLFAWLASWRRTATLEKKTFGAHEGSWSKWPIADQNGLGSYLGHRGGQRVLRSCFVGNVWHGSFPWSVSWFSVVRCLRWI